MNASRCYAAIAVMCLVCLVAIGQSPSPPTTSAVLPRLIRVSGTVTDQAARRTGASGAIFSLYAAETGGAALWSEAQSIRIEAGGHYTVLLGTNTAEGLPVELFASGEVHWLGITIEGREQPRMQIASVPYALKAKDSETLNGLSIGELFAQFASWQKQNGSASTETVPVANAPLTNSTTGSQITKGSAILTTATNFTDTTSNQVVSVVQNGTGSAVVGTTPSPTGYGLSGINTSTTGSARGIYGESNSANTSAAGVYGISKATTGVTYCVLGLTSSTSGTALNGTATATTGNTIGLRGQANSSTGTGVQGAEASATGLTTGVNGFVLSPSGTAGVFDNRAGGQILSLRNNGVEELSVTGAGDVVTSGSITATTINGDGSGLTNVPTLAQVNAIVYSHTPSGRALWAKSDIATGIAQAVIPNSVAVDPTGDVIVVGYVTGNADFGGGTLTPVGGADMFVTKYSSDGTLKWAKMFGGAGQDLALRVATDSSSNIFIAGYSTANFSFCLACPTLTNQGGQDIILAKLDSSGTHVWSKDIGGTGTETFGTGYGSMTVDSSGNVILGFSSASPTVDAGGGGMVSLGGTDVVIAKYANGGVHSWSHRYGGAASEFVDSLAVDNTGNVYLGIDYYAAASFGGAPLPAPANGSLEIVKYDLNGNFSWQKPFSASGGQLIPDIVIANSSGVAVAGKITAPSVDFGTGTLTAGEYIVRLDSLGTVVWAHSYGQASINIRGMCWGMCYDQTGNYLLAGVASAALDFGAGPLAYGGSGDVLVAKLDASGQLVWAEDIGGAALEQGLGVAAEANGDPVLAGVYYGYIDLGSGTLPNANGNAHTYVARLKQ